MTEKKWFSLQTCAWFISNTAEKDKFVPNLWELQLMHVTHKKIYVGDRSGLFSKGIDTIFNFVPYFLSNFVKNKL